MANNSKAKAPADVAKNAFTPEQIADIVGPAYILSQLHQWLIHYCSWFYGFISTSEASKILQDHNIDGGFLFRFSTSDENSFALSCMSNGQANILWIDVAILTFIFLVRLLIGELPWKNLTLILLQNSKSTMRYTIALGI
jgi:hypothetical protein